MQSRKLKSDAQAKTSPPRRTEGQREEKTPSLGGTLPVEAHVSMLDRGIDSRSSCVGRSLLQLQHRYGNRYVQRVVASAQKRGGGSGLLPGKVRPKLVASEPGDRYDRYEWEAEQAASAIVQGVAVSRAALRTLHPAAGTISRAVSSDYDTIEDNLTYGLFDWAITDEEAQQILDILLGLNNTDLADTIQEMENAGLVDRLIENIAQADRTTYASLIESIHQLRSTSTTAGHIENLMSYGLLDWVISDEEAHLALETLKNLQSNPTQLRDVVVAIPQTQYERFYDNLSEQDRSANLQFLQGIEMMRFTGMTLDEMSQAQLTHLETEAAAAGVSVGEHIRSEAGTRGYGGYTATWWPSLLPAQQQAWRDRFDDVVEDIRNTAPQELIDVIEAAEAAGGGIQFLPADIERGGPNAVALRRGNVLGVGKLWVEAAENDLTSVFNNIAHELGGHREYGTPTSWDIMSGTLGLLPPAERAIAESGPRSIYSAYGYMETEIYAEMRELPYRTPGSIGDDPVDNIEEELEDLRDAYDPTIAEAIVRGFRRRVELDSQITDEARALFDRKAYAVFGITF